MLMRTLKRALIAPAIALGLTMAVASPSHAAGDAISYPSQSWSFSGFFGTFDRASLQRGFQVYKDVCASCHSLKLMAYRNLSALGFTEEEVKAIAAQMVVKDGPNDQGDMFERPGRPSDKFVAPFANDQAARAANGGALPPDLSLMIKARPGGADYVNALMTGYANAPDGFELLDGQYYNKYFAGHKIAMPPPLADEQVTYADGTPATVAQMSLDVAHFLAWTAEPELEARKKLGLKVMLFLSILTLLLYGVKRKVWADLH